MKIRRILTCALATLIILVNVNVDNRIFLGGAKAYAGTNSMTVYFSSGPQSQSKVITIPNLVSISNMSVSTGNVAYSTNGNSVTINVSNGTSTSQSSGTTSASTYQTSSSNSFPSSVSYGGGTLSKSGSSYVISGSYTEGDSRIEITTRTASTISGLPSSISYNSGGYSGTLYWSNYPSGSSGNYTVTYSGTVTKPGSDTRVWRQDYSGSIPYTNYYYSYEVTVNYISNTAPSISIAAPAANSVYSAQNGKNTLALSGTIYDSDIGDTDIIYYRIDGSIGQTGKQLCTAITTNNTNQAFSGPVDVSSLAEGSHTLYAWVQDGQGVKSAESAVAFKVDKTAPTVTAPALTASGTTSITVQPNAADPVTNGVSAGLNAVPYLYNRNGADIGTWQAGNLDDTGLTPNTQYTYKYEARDDVLNTSIYSAIASKYTLASVPLLTVNNPTSCTLDIATSDNNPSNTQYQIWTGSSYVSQTGVLSTTAQWIMLTGKKITVTELDPKNTYTFYAVARNGDGITTATSAGISRTTLVAPPTAPETPTFSAIKATSMTIAWAAVQGALSYEVSVDGNTISSNVTSYTQTGLQPGTSHSFSVRAKNENPNPGPWSNIVSGLTLPGIPVITTTTPSTISIDLSWTLVTGATGYDLSVNSNIVTGAGTSTVYSNTGLSPNTKCTYAVRAKNASGTGDWSTALTVYTLAQKPSSGSIVAITNNTITAAWQGTGNPAGTQYILAAFDQNNTLKAQTLTTYLTDKVTGLDSDTSYKIKVKAINGDNKETEWLEISCDTKTAPTPPLIPVWKEAYITSGGIILFWNPAERAEGYDLKRTDSSGSAIVINVTDTTYTDTDLVRDTTYTYKLQANNAGGSSGYGDALSAVLPSPPLVPQGFSAVSGTASITLSWQAVANAIGYIIEADGKAKEVGNVTTYTFGNLPKGTEHKYRILAYNLGGSSAYTGELKALTLLDTPTNITAAATNSRIIMSWSPVEGAAGYEVNIGSSTYPVTGNTYSCENLAPSTLYTYKVRAVNKVSTGGWSSEGTVTTLPNPPSNITVAAASISLTVNWSPAAGATGYDVMVDNRLISGITGTSCTIEGLQPSTQHTVKVRARVGNEKSSWSSTIAQATLPLPEDIPSAITAAAATDCITVSWETVAGAEGYEVEVDQTTPQSINTNTYTHSGLQPGQTHTYRVRSVKEGVQGGWSQAVTVATRTNSLGIPLNLKAEVTDTTAALTWTPVDGASSYEIQLDGQEPVTGITGTAYTIAGFEPETNHNIKIRVKSGEIQGDWSNSLSILTLPSAPQPPTGFGAKAGQNGVTLTWNLMPEAQAFELLVDDTTSETVTGAVYSIGGLAPSTQHTYKIRSIGEFSAGAWSEPLTITTLSDIPAVPSGINAVSTNSTVEIAWSGVETAKTYDIEIDGSIVGTTDTQYIKTGFEPDTSHTFRVRAVNGTKTSDWSEYRTISTLPDKPEVPGGISITTSKDAITVTYGSADRASGYDVEVDEKASDNGNQTSFTKTGLLPGTQHTIRVRAKNAGGTSDWSTAVTVLTQSDIPGAPEKITTGATTHSVTITWSPVSGATSYDIEADENTISIGTSLQYTDTGLISGTSHTYRVRANSTGGNGNWSMPVTKATMLAAPADLAPGTQDGISITWSPVEGAASYDVEIDGSAILTVTDVKFEMEGARPNQKHTYRVRARNAVSTSSWSGSITAQTQASVYTGSFTQDETFGFDINALNIPDINSTRFTITYDPTQLELVDLCALTDIPDITEGSIPDSNIRVVKYTPGTIVIAVNETELSGEYSGTIDTITFRSKTNGQAEISYSIPMPAEYTIDGYTSDMQAPTAPADLTATEITGTTATLVWTEATDNTGVTGYEIYNRGQLLASSDSTSIQITGLEPGTLYSLTVNAKDAAGNLSEASNILNITTDAVGALAAPTFSPAGGSYSSEQTVSISCATSGADIRYTTDGSTPISTSPLYTAPITVTGSQTIKACAAKDGRTDSKVSSANYIIDTEAPTAPTNLTSPTKTSSSITLSWTAASDNVGVIGYDIYIGSTLAASTSTTAVKITGLTASTAYSFKVKAKDAAGNTSTASSALNLTTSAYAASSLLSGLAINGTEIGGFNSSTFSYENTVPLGTTSITITPTAQDSNAVVYVNNILVSSGQASAPIALKPGVTNISVSVKPAVGGTQTYTIAVTRPTSEYLTNLTLSSGMLDQAFSKATNTYTASVGYDTTSITVTPIAEDPTAVISVNGNVVASGQASEVIPLDVGSNTIQVIVTSATGGSQTYTVTVNRKALYLSNLVIKSVMTTISINPQPFSSTTYKYTANAGARISISVIPTLAEGTSATITVNGVQVASGSSATAQLPIVGVNIIEIVLTSDTSVNKYIIEATRTR